RRITPATILRNCARRARRNFPVEMPEFSTTRRVRHSAADMFDLVADVERYPEFVPLCSKLRIKSRSEKSEGIEVIVADMTVAFKLLRESFKSRVTLD